MHNLFAYAFVIVSFLVCAARTRNAPHPHSLAFWPAALPRRLRTRTGPVSAFYDLDSVRALQFVFNFIIYINCLYRLVRFEVSVRDKASEKM